MLNANYKPLKLRAEDDNDLEILSKCLFEASNKHFDKISKSLSSSARSLSGL